MNPRGITTACTRPPTRRWSSSNNRAGRRVMPGVRRSIIAEVCGGIMGYRAMAVTTLFILLACENALAGEIPFAKSEPLTGERTLCAEIRDFVGPRREHTAESLTLQLRLSRD